jgi:hypothetical protein
VNVGVERETGHHEDGIGHALDIHPWFDGKPAVGLGDALGHPRGHFGRGVADVDLAAGDVIPPAIEGSGFGQPGDRVLGA